jgi:hypothetical protein
MKHSLLRVILQSGLRWVGLWRGKENLNTSPGFGGA